MKMKLDLGKFKLGKRDESFATLHHPDGHTIKIAVAALHPENRKSLDALEPHVAGVAKKAQMKTAKMADGGDVDTYDEAESTAGEDRHVQSKGAEAFGNSMKKLGQGDGGSPVQKQADPIISITPVVRVASGGEIKKPEKLEYEPYQEPKLEAEAIRPKNPVEYEPYEEPKRKKYADGTDNVSGDPSVDDSAGQQGIAPQPLEYEPYKGEDAPTEQPRVPATLDQPDAVVAGQPPAAGNSLLAQSVPKPAEPVNPQDPSQPLPDTYHGYKEQQTGIQREANAQAAAAQAQEQALKAKGAAVEKLQTDYQTHVGNLDKERQSFIQDIKDKHIDPDHYMGTRSTGGKIATAIGLLLGGMAGGGHGNVALDILNKNIDNDIEAQKADLGKRETLLSANMQQYKNVHDATAMTRTMMFDNAQTQIDRAAAKSQSPIIQARAQALKGQLEQQIAPTMQQIALRRTLQTGDVSQQDPATFVPMVVPKERQKDVLHEIGQAQNAQKNSDIMLKNFDTAAKENTVFGRLGRAGYTPPSILAMRAAFLPIIHDAEGRVNEFEQKTTSDLEPMPGDTDKTVAAKKQAMIQFLQQKEAAPNAKAFGIDLEKFKSTSSDRSKRLSPQDQQYVEWARANPSNPKAQMVLKKLGL